MIKFYFHPTPNPMKVALIFEELGLDFEVVPVDTMKGEQHLPAFTAINPNAKVPAIDDEGTIVFDSNAILIYIAEKYGKELLGADANRGELLSWMMFIGTGIGPFSGQAVHFQHFAPEKIEYAINRYRREIQRLYSVLDAKLAGKEYIVGDSYTIADISAWGWLDRVGFVLGENALDDYPNLKTWFARIDARPAVEKARKVGSDIQFKKERDEEALRAMFPQNYAK